MTITSAELKVHGDFAYDTGTYKQTLMAMKGGGDDRRSRQVRRAPQEGRERQLVDLRTRFTTATCPLPAPAPAKKYAIPFATALLPIATSSSTRPGASRRSGRRRGGRRSRSSPAKCAASTSSSTAACRAGRWSLSPKTTEGTPAGFAFLEPAVDYFSGERHGHLGMIAVTAEAEGHGAGAALMRAAEDWARGCGYAKLTLNVFEGNQRARQGLRAVRLQGGDRSAYREGHWIKIWIPCAGRSCCSPSATLRRSPSAPERAIVSAVDAGNAAALALLENAVNINSGTQNFAGVRAVGDLFRKEFDALGFKTTWVDGAAFKRAGHLVADHPGHGAAHPPHRPSRHGLRARQPVPEVRAARRQDRDGSRHHRHEGRRRHHRRRAQGAEGRRRARRHERHRRHDGRRGGFRRSAGRGARGAGRRGAGARSTRSGSRTAPAIRASRSPPAAALRRGSSQVKGKTGHSSQIFRPDLGYGANYELARILDGFRRKLAGEEHLTFNPSLDARRHGRRRRRRPEPRLRVGQDQRDRRDAPWRSATCGRCRRSSSQHARDTMKAVVADGAAGADRGDADVRRRLSVAAADRGQRAAARRVRSGQPGPRLRAGGRRQPRSRRRRRRVVHLRRGEEHHRRHRPDGARRSFAVARPPISRRCRARPSARRSCCIVCNHPGR